MALRVLLWHPQESGIPGGHVVQFDRTAQALRDLGVEVVQCNTSAGPSTLDVDVVHGFALDAAQVRRARSVGVPVVLSTIWWDLSYRRGLQSPPDLSGLIGRVRTAGSFAVAALRRSHYDVVERLDGQRHRAALAFEAADMILPNSEGEARSVRRDLAISTPHHVVPNAADDQIFAPPRAGTPREGVIMVGRIEPHKNQLGLIRALRGTGLRLTIVGPDHPHHARYARRIRKAAGRAVAVLGRQSNEDMLHLMQTHKVHVLPSRFETTGLVSLEAGLAGCAIVSTNRGYAREYLDDLAWYCDPYALKSIRTAVLKAYESPPSDALRQRILAHYTWRHTAEATVAAYRRVLTARGVRS